MWMGLARLHYQTKKNGDGRDTKREQRVECPKDVDLDEQTQSSNEGPKSIDWG